MARWGSIVVKLNEWVTCCRLRPSVYLDVESVWWCLNPLRWIHLQRLNLMSKNEMVRNKGTAFSWQLESKAKRYSLPQVS